MYELVHTSAANGLIAGTHGYAPVEMTRSLPDGLRNRVEVFCGYAHRGDGVNPVNWFHAILEKGEHVVGRVAACEKDYTGRTNRLAKVRIWGAGEMPRCGAGELLATGGEWFRAAWDGEVKYLEEGAKGSAWARVFGARGDELCQRVAWQVERNLETGKSLYFRVSAGWDCDGEKLLGLFREVIGAMGEEARRRVTFATYPAAMPGGAVCHLRGSLVEDEDAGFERARGACAWVDCVEGRVEHEEFLPREGLKKVDARKEELAAAKGEIEKLKAQIVTEQRAADFARAYAKKLQDEKAQGADGSQATWLKMQAKLEGELARARGWCWAFAILSVVLILIGVGIYWGAAKVEKVEAAPVVATAKEEVVPVKVEVAKEAPRSVEKVEASVKKIEIKKEVPRDGARAPNPLCNGPAERPIAKRGAEEEEEEKPKLSIRAAEEVPRKKLDVKSMGEELFSK
jgi:hypothetical protein